MCSKICWTIMYTILLFHFTNGQEKSKQKCVEYMEKVYSETAFRAIVGGIATKHHEFPYIAALGFEDDGSIRWDCGGSLISDRYILTAGHCTNHRELGEVQTIRLGATSLDKKQRKDDYGVAQIIRHPDYKPPSHYNDVALLKLNKKVTFTNKVFPACLQYDFDIGQRGDKLTAIGWGFLSFAGPKSDKLMKVDLQISSREQCNQSYRSVSKNKLPDGINDEIQICAAGGDGESKDTCQGDSGGPLEYKSGKYHYIVGVTSFGKACGIGGTPGVYTRVSSYVKWIESIISS